MKKKIYLFLAFALTGLQSISGQNFWKKTKIDERNLIEAKRNIGVDYSNAYILEINRLKTVLQSTPVSETGMKIISQVVIDIPALDGGFERYRVYETSNMSPELAKKFPDIKSYRGISVKNPGNTISFGLSPAGIKMILFYQDKKPVVIEPATTDKSVYLVSPAVPDLLPNSNNIGCTTQGKNNAQKNNFPTDNTDDKKFRTFRLAVSVDGEFSEYHGSTVANSLAAINDLMSYINPVYENDLSIHMNLIPNNEQIIYLDKNTDPYNPTSTNTLNDQVQTTLTNVIGEANYDIGIIFTNQTGGGNAGMIASVCQNSQGIVNGKVDQKKGSAYAGPVNGTGPQGFIYAMVIAHEMGHQYGANHTFSRPENIDFSIFFNSPETGANREPGSGTTIMGYPGVTGTYDVADKHSNQFLHYSISQINKYIKTTSCATTVNISNNPPTVNAGQDYTIPKGTAFKLTATASDPDNNNLTYSWEEADISAPNPPFVLYGSYTFPDRTSATTPNFRVYPPVTSPTRHFPPLKEVLDGSLYSTWNMVSDVARNMKFISLVRDNAPEGGQTASDEAIVSINENAGPFKITSISLNQNYSSGSSHLLKWDVAGTNAAPISTQSVNILISTDGGNTFTPLVSNTANDGEEMITIPSTPSQKAYIIVESVGNIYYAASPAFAINYNVTMNCTRYPVNGPIPIAPNAPATMNVTIPSTNSVEDINVVMDLSYTDLENIALTLKAPSDQKNQIFWYSNCPGKNVLKAIFDQEGESSAINCNNLNAATPVRIEPIRLDLSKYYGQNPSGNWIIRAVDVSSNTTSSGMVNSAAIELCSRETVSTLAVNDLTLENDEFQVYPNPSNGKFNILMKKNTTTEVNIFDIAGRLVHSQDGITNASQIDLTNFAKGNYIMVFSTGDKKITKKIIIK
ncbi:M12 family metallo-peptidase [Chryseobacterium gallinarum]|uniref:reprolysin-like metallopeptidase n=1 Tax=Chryseobacterium gallinarum TaxID=1324352 RepID=UPI0020242C20|nr:zinc-dependent metalloprotease family protein [Chryseobacterium gallinarum]MCL8538799.1 M12 family metallo-peptidase [Chryseobacterium gallinarum]